LSADATRRILLTLSALERWGHEHEWSGTDQYDGLNATRVPSFATDSALGKRLLIQAVKRSPVDLRPLLGIPAGQNAVSLAWAAQAYALNGFMDAAEADRRRVALLRRLDELRSPRFREPCWGYHFDFQSRVFFYPKTAPNTIATAYAGMALLDSYEHSGEEDLLERAHGTGAFFMRHVPQTDDPPGAFFGYLPGDRSPIHNSNMHVCALLARLSDLTGDEVMRDAAEKGVKWTVARQRSDGSWPYGERSNLQWVDGFHTGYVLDALTACARVGLPGATEALLAGLEFYRRRMLLPDGTPKYYESRVHPIDMWSVAQAIQTLSIAADADERALEDALTVFRFADRTMRRRDGMFLFQRRRFWRNQAIHVRGVVAPMFVALTHLAARLAAAERGLPTPESIHGTGPTHGRPQVTLSAEPGS
jgi:hypothetical protein